MDDLKKYIVDFIATNGPTLPITISKKIGKPLIITNAILSQLCEDGLLQKTSMQIGSSNIYFLRGQEQQLENFISYLKGSEKIAIERLKKEKVLQHEGLDLALKVALANMKDFAKVIKVRIGNEEKIFWKYFLVSNQEAEAIINERFKVAEQQQPLPSVPLQLPTQLQPSTSITSTLQTPQAIKPQPSQPMIQEKPLQLQQQLIPEVQKKEEAREVWEGEKEEKERGEEKAEIEKAKKAEKKKERKKGKVAKKKVTPEDFISFINANFSSIRKINDAMYEASKEIVDEKIKFLVVIKAKERISDVDLILAMREGEERKMPVIVLTKGTLTKKAKEIASKSGSFLIVKHL
jgi:hypothetical protein